MTSLIDRLLGRTTLKERIQELEDENESLRNRLEAEEERRSDAVRQKQEAEREINRMEDRIHELEDRVERAEDEAEERHRHGFRYVDELLPGQTRKAVSLVSSIEGSGESLTTAYVYPGDDLPNPEDYSSESLGLLRGIDSETGLVVLRDDSRLISACLSPPLRVDETRVSYGDTFEVDRFLFEPPERYVLGVVRAGSFSVGYYEGGDPVETEYVTTNVKSQHSKGGWSQSRFERIRDEQIDEHVERSVEALERLLDTVGSDDGLLVAVVGHEALIDEVAQRTDTDVFTKPSDARGEKKELLEDGRESLWSSRLYVF
ncbi:MAG: Vms1/Ankzf1 family peptidyl-tRNA hydrolase [Halobacteria archaeon]|nr:Vms1/Ankzf1 family peptidyl-tRNA hydrolase [Halobacteria archaeon]